MLITRKCVPPVDLLTTLLWAGRNGLPPTPDTLHLGCSYHLHSSHRFLSTWGAVMLEKMNKTKKKFPINLYGHSIIPRPLPSLPSLVIQKILIHNPMCHDVMIWAWFIYCSFVYCCFIYFRFV